MRYWRGNDCMIIDLGLDILHDFLASRACRADGVAYRGV